MTYKEHRPIKTSVALSESNHNWLDDEAKKHNTSKSEVVNKLIDKERSNADEIGID